jgi:prolipoprotein diacylglyceryl transferase
MSLPTPTSSLIEVGPLTIHYYALCILLGIAAAIVISRGRYRRAGGNPDEINQLAAYAIPAGIIGGRAYHVITSPDAYFGANGRPLDAIKIWQGGMGIWGAIALGSLTVWLLIKRGNYSLTFLIVADVLAPGLLIAQAIGRWGNWFNAELFGSPTSLPWGLSIPPSARPDGFQNFATFHPTFLYESLWCLLAALLLLRSGRLQNWITTLPGQTFLAYISLYTLGRLWIEALRIDSAHHLFGVRINIFVALVICIASTTALLRRRRLPDPANPASAQQD